MITATTFYIAFGILALAIIGLLLLFLWFINKNNKKIEEINYENEKASKTYTNNKITELDRSTPKCEINGNGEVILFTPDGKTEIGLIGNLSKKTTK